MKSGWQIVERASGFTPGRNSERLPQMDFPPQLFDEIARKLLAAATEATASAPNEASLRHELENALEKACRALGVAWTPFRLDLTLPTSEPRRKRFADVAHGRGRAARGHGCRRAGYREPVRFRKCQEVVETCHGSVRPLGYHRSVASIGGRRIFRTVFRWTLLLVAAFYAVCLVFIGEYIEKITNNNKALKLSRN